LIPLEGHIKRRLDEAKSAGLLRHIPTVEERDATTIMFGSKTLLNFSSNDYLGLSHHPAVRAAAAEAAEHAPTSSSASRLISGDSPQIRRLEETLADLKRRPSALVFPSGYHANIGTISALCSQNDFILSDRDNHASIVDACRLSKANTIIFDHNDPESLDSALRKLPTDSFCLVVTETVFSTDGSVAPLPDILAVCERYGAALMIDEAHATGTLGATGRGGEEEFGLEGGCHIVMGTLGKALASVGGFVAASPELIHLLINYSRTLIYSTAPTPQAAAAATAAVKTLLEERELLRKLRRNISIFVETLDDSDCVIKRKHPTPIVPVRVGDERETMELRARLMEKGFYTAALRYPTVPKGEAMLRVSLSAAHSEEDVVSLAENIKNLLGSRRRR